MSAFWEEECPDEELSKLNNQKWILYMEVKSIFVDHFS